MKKDERHCISLSDESIPPGPLHYGSVTSICSTPSRGRQLSLTSTEYSALTQQRQLAEAAAERERAPLRLDSRTHSERAREAPVISTAVAVTQI